MPNNKDKTEIKPLRPITSILDWLTTLLLAFITSCVALFSFFSRSWFAFAASVCIGLIGLVVLRTRRLEPETRRRGIICSLPVAFGVALSIYPFQSAIPLLIGFGGTIALAVWFGILRHPVELRQALEQFRAGKKLQAAQLTTLAIEKHPTHWESYQFRSVINSSLFRIVEAERDARVAMRLKPDNHTCHNALGQALLAQERYSEADNAFSKAVELAPHYAFNHYCKGIVCYRLEQFNEAIRYLKFTIRGRMPFEEWRLLANYYLGCSLLHIGETKKAQKAFQALKRFRHVYDRMVELYQDVPDYPAALQFRRELEDINNHLV